MTTIVLSPATPEIEPLASSLTPPVVNFTAAYTFDRDKPFIVCRTGVYYVAQDKETGSYWNHSTNAFEVFNGDDWSNYLKPMYYRGPGLWGAFVGADTFPAGKVLAVKVYSNITNNGERGTEANGGDRQIGAFTSEVWPAPLPRTVAVNHDTGGSDSLRVVDPGNNGIEDVAITAYLATEYAVQGVAAVARGRSTTDEHGRWTNGIRLMPTTAYTLHLSKDGYAIPPLTVTTGERS